MLDPQALSSRRRQTTSISALAFDGTNFLVAWQDWRSDSDCDIYGARVTPEGTVLDPSGIVISQAANSSTPALALTARTSSWCGKTTAAAADSDIYGARVTPAGVVFNEGPVVRQEGNQSYSALARGSGSQMFLVYQGWVGTVGSKYLNTQRIWGKMDPNPGIEESFQASSLKPQAVANHRPQCAVPARQPQATSHLQACWMRQDAGRSTCIPARMM